MWYGYIHINGSLHVRLIMHPSEVDEARESKFIEWVSDPYPASNRKHAMEILKDILDK